MLLLDDISLDGVEIGTGVFRPETQQTNFQDGLTNGGAQSRLIYREFPC